MATIFSVRGVFAKKEKNVVKEQRGEGTGVEQWSGYHEDEGEETWKIGDPPKIRKMRIKEKAQGKSSFSRWSKRLRRDALSPTLEHHV